MDPGCARYRSPKENTHYWHHALICHSLQIKLLVRKKKEASWVDILNWERILDEWKYVFKIIIANVLLDTGKYLAEWTSSKTYCKNLSESLRCRWVSGVPVWPGSLNQLLIYDKVNWSHNLQHKISMFGEFTKSTCISPNFFLVQCEVGGANFDQDCVNLTLTNYNNKASSSYLFYYYF